MHGHLLLRRRAKQEAVQGARISVARAALSPGIRSVAIISRVDKSLRLNSERDVLTSASNDWSGNSQEFFRHRSSCADRGLRRTAPEDYECGAALPTAGLLERRRRFGLAENYRQHLRPASLLLQGQTARRRINGFHWQAGIRHAARLLHRFLETRGPRLERLRRLRGRSRQRREIKYRLAQGFQAAGHSLRRGTDAVRDVFPGRLRDAPGLRPAVRGVARLHPVASRHGRDFLQRFASRHTGDRETGSRHAGLHHSA